MSKKGTKRTGRSNGPQRTIRHLELLQLRTCGTNMQTIEQVQLLELTELVQLIEQVNLMGHIV